MAVLWLNGKAVVISRRRQVSGFELRQILDVPASNNLVEVGGRHVDERVIPETGEKQYLATLRDLTTRPK